MQTIPHIRTFSGRHGGLSLTQKRAVTDLLSKYQMPQEAWDFDELFDSRKVVIEIGSGNGTSSLAYAKEFSDQINNLRLVATDWEQYAQVLRDQFNARLNPRPTWRPVTKFEKKAIKGGRTVVELAIGS